MFFKCFVAASALGSDALVVVYTYAYLEITQDHSHGTHWAHLLIPHTPGREAFHEAIFFAASSARRCHPCETVTSIKAYFVVRRDTRPRLGGNLNLSPFPLHHPTPSSSSPLRVPDPSSPTRRLHHRFSWMLWTAIITFAVLLPGVGRRRYRPRSAGVARRGYTTTNNNNNNNNKASHAQPISCW